MFNQFILLKMRQRTKLFLLIIAFVAYQAGLNAQKEAQQIDKLLNAKYPYYEKLYKHFHQNPELSFMEVKTSKRVAEELRKAGFKVTENFGGNNLVGVLENGKGPTLLIRADMDALPIEEETGLPYKSTAKVKDVQGKTQPAMHACGHDMHMTVFVGTANTLAKLKSKWKGTLIMVGQQAEEVSGGAKLMIETGLFKKFKKPDNCIALHVSSEIEAGKVGIKPGPFFASTDMIDVTVFGKGGHGAMPHNTIDPVVLSARIINAFQTIVSREISPQETAVLSIGSIHGGSKHNIIPNEVKMQLTVRTYSDEVRELIIRRMKEISKGIAISAGLSSDKYPIVTVRNESTAAVINNPKLAANMEKYFVELLGRDNVLKVPAVMTGEDFAMYGKTEDNIPICLYWLGTVSHENIVKHEKENFSLPGLHSSKFAPDVEKSIKTGVKAMAGAALKLLKK